MSDPPDLDLATVYSIFRASFTKQGKLAQERNSKRAQMGGEISAFLSS